jgi:hypothetical protein
MFYTLVVFRIIDVSGNHYHTSKLRLLMKTKLLLTLSFVTFQVAFAQNDNTDAIVAEGKRLYHSEMASWYGTDVFLEKFKDQRENIGGYFSYESQGSSKCIFYSKEQTPTVLATITFDSTYNIATVKVDNTPRGFTQYEQDLASLRVKAMEVINSDTLFKSYNNTNLNLIPIISAGERRAYVLTGPKTSGIVILGNDYLLTFDQDNNLTSKRQLHRNIIPIEYGKGDQEVFGTMHSHLPETGEFITATDICTLMLYGKFANWKQHIVVSENHISIWDFQSNQLATLTKEAWERINKGTEKRKKKK